jgi:LacI family transcriptional regulator, gluconate utilization system Gnt-I transcriptional repressor
MAKLPGLAEIAAALGVSQMTVSRALRGVEGVSAARRNEVLTAARTLGYRPNRAAQSLAVAHSNLVCISLPTLYNDVFAEVLSGMRNPLDHAGLDVVLDVCDYDVRREAAWVERMLEWRPAAIVLTGVEHGPGVRESLRAAAIPTLEIWDVTDDPIDVCVGVDHFAGGVMIGAWLKSLGYKRPSFVGTTKDARAEKRFLGLASVFGGGRVGVVRTTETGNFVEGAKATDTLLRGDRPDVIAFVNDHMAFGGLCAIERAGLRCPEDIGVVGFNALALNSVLPVKITTVATPRREMGELGSKHLIARTKGVRTPAHTSLPLRLIEGETTRRQ